MVSEQMTELSEEHPEELGGWRRILVLLNWDLQRQRRVSIGQCHQSGWWDLSFMDHYAKQRIERPWPLGAEPSSQWPLSFASVI